MNAAACILPRTFVFILLTVVAIPPASALDTLAMEFGTTESDNDVDRYGGAARWNIGGLWAQVGDWRLVTYVEFSVTYWDGKQGRSGEDDLIDFALTPVLRYQRDPAQGIAPFVEIGVGAHGYTEEGIGNDDFDIPFAFGSHLGAGLRFGTHGSYEIVYRFQHQSNAGLGDDNPGMNFHVVQLGYHF